MEQVNIDRFSKLFSGNIRSFGLFNKKSGKVRTEHRCFTIEDFANHLNGITGIGIVPIMDDGMCWFGAIDVDAHGDAPDIDLVSLERKVKELDLPLVVCRSKSGGAHLYLFGSEPLSASLVRTALGKWAESLGHAGVEIFPKQSKLPMDNTGQQQYGNWLNLCLFDPENPEQLRYPVEGGKKIDLEYFLDIAEARRITGAMLVERSDTDHNGAPPCIQKMIAKGVGRGHRNEALYNICIYVKQAYPETWRDKAHDFNAKLFDVPLVHDEAKKIIASTARKDYRYKCSEEPCKSLCNSSVCVTRKFGISGEEKGELELGKTPEFKNMRKIETDPIKWIMEVEGEDIVMATSELADFRQARNKIFERIHRMLPPIKNDRWAILINKMMKECTIIEAPDDASPSGLIRTKLREFIQKTDYEVDPKDPSARMPLQLGMPVLQDRDGHNVIYFRGTDFIEFLKRTRSEELRGPNMWMALRTSGVNHGQLRVEGTSIQVWYVRVDDNNNIKLKAPEIKNEF